MKLKYLLLFIPTNLICATSYGAAAGALDPAVPHVPAGACPIPVLSPDGTPNYMYAHSSLSSYPRGVCITEGVWTNSHVPPAGSEDATYRLNVYSICERRGCPDWERFTKDVLAKLNANPKLKVPLTSDDVAFAVVNASLAMVQFTLSGEAKAGGQIMKGATGGWGGC